MEYKVINVRKDYFATDPIANALDELTYKVNSEIQKAWKPQGGISIIKDDGYTWVSQALVKE